MRLSIFASILIAATSVIASTLPLRRDDAPDFVTCTFTLHSEVPVDPNTPGLEDDFHFAIGSSLIAATNGGTLTSGGPSTVIPNPDDSYTIIGIIAVSDHTAAQTGDVLEGFAGEVKHGNLADWTIDIVSCDA